MSDVRPSMLPDRHHHPFLPKSGIRPLEYAPPSLANDASYGSFGSDESHEDNSARALHGNSAGQAATAIFKAVMGTGIFLLPSAIRASGLLLGTLMCVVMAAVLLFTTSAILHVIGALRKQGMAGSRDGRIEFQHVTALAYPRANGSISMLCVIGQLGTVVGFFDFVAVNLEPLVPEVLTHCSANQLANQSLLSTATETLSPI